MIFISDAVIDEHNGYTKGLYLYLNDKTYYIIRAENDGLMCRECKDKEGLKIGN